MANFFDNILGALAVFLLLAIPIGFAICGIKLIDRIMLRTEALSIKLPFLGKYSSVIKNSISIALIISGIALWLASSVNILFFKNNLFDIGFLALIYSLLAIYLGFKLRMYSFVALCLRSRYHVFLASTLYATTAIILIFYNVYDSHFYPLSLIIVIYFAIYSYDLIKCCKLPDSFFALNPTIVRMPAYAMKFSENAIKIDDNQNLASIWLELCIGSMDKLKNEIILKQTFNHNDKCFFKNMLNHSENSLYPDTALLRTYVGNTVLEKNIDLNTEIQSGYYAQINYTGSIQSIFAQLPLLMYRIQAMRINYTGSLPLIEWVNFNKSDTQHFKLYFLLK